MFQHNFYKHQNIFTELIITHNVGKVATHLFLILCGRDPFNDGDRRVTYKEINQILNISRASFYRAKAELVKAGLMKFTETIGELYKVPEPSHSKGSLKSETPCLTSENNSLKSETPCLTSENNSLKYETHTSPKPSDIAMSSEPKTLKTKKTIHTLQIENQEFEKISEISETIAKSGTNVIDVKSEIVEEKKDMVKPVLRGEYVEPNENDVKQLRNRDDLSLLQKVETALKNRDFVRHMEIGTSNWEFEIKDLKSFLLAKNHFYRFYGEYLQVYRLKKEEEKRREYFLKKEEERRLTEEIRVSKLSPIEIKLEAIAKQINEEEGAIERLYKKIASLGKFVVNVAKGETNMAQGFIDKAREQLNSKKVALATLIDQQEILLAQVAI